MAHKKSVAYNTGSLILLVAVIGAVFVVNFLSDKGFTRIDLTRNKQFTLSDSTKKLLKDLPDIVNVRAVYSSNIPAPWNQVTGEVQDLLREYKANGKGKFVLKMEDPVGDAELQEDLGKIGINPVALPVRGLDQASTIKIWAAIYIQYRDKSETIPYAFSTETLEYDLTTAIDRLTSNELVEVGLYNADGPQRNLMDEFGTLTDALKKSYQVVEVPNEEGKIGDAVKVLLVISPFGATDVDLYNIDQFIMRGGKAIFLVDGARVILQPGQFGTPMPFYAMAMNEQMDSIGGMLQHYGVKRNYDLVQDKPFMDYPVLGPLGREYPLFPVIELTGEGKEENPITQGLDFLVFTWASSLDVSGAPDSVKVTRLAVTSKDSWIQAGQQLMVDPMTEAMPPLPIGGMGPAKRDLAVLLSGKFKSYFEGKPAPTPEEGDSVAPPDQSARSDESPETDVMVVGCSQFVSNNVPIDVSHNVGFIVSAVDWMAGGKKLSDIRKRNVSAKPIDDLTIGKAVMIGLVMPLLAPALVVVFGLARYGVRMGRQKKFLESVEP